MTSQTKTRNGLVDSGYKLVLDLCQSDPKKIFFARHIGKRTICHVEEFLLRHELSFGMTFKPEFVEKIREESARIT
jgi:hypothetical protein